MPPPLRGKGWMVGDLAKTNGWLLFLIFFIVCCGGWTIPIYILALLGII